MEGVYLIGNQKYGWYKIGQSQDVDKRLNDGVQPCCPVDLGLVSFWPCRRKYTRKLEAYLHETFAQHRMHGEWFELCEQDIVLIHYAVKRWFEKNNLKPSVALVHPYFGGKL